MPVFRLPARVSVANKKAAGLARTGKTEAGRVESYNPGSIAGCHNVIISIRDFSCTIVATTEDIESQ